MAPKPSFERAENAARFDSLRFAPAAPQLRVWVFMIRRLAPYICIGLFIPISASSNNDNWNVLQSATNSDSGNHIVIHVKLVEDQRLRLDSGIRVGNIGTPANPRPRKLIIETTNNPKRPEGQAWELVVPAKTRQGDECSVVDVSELSVTGSFVTVSLDYQFACGAGSSIVATQRFSVSKSALRLTSVQLASASRDGTGLTTIDFVNGEVLEAFDRPEDDKPKPSKKFWFKPYVVSIDPRILVRCPFPLRGSEMPDCTSGIHRQRNAP